MGPYTRQDAGKSTDANDAETSAAWHQARTDDQRSDSPSVDYGDREATDSNYDSSWEDD